MNTDAEPQLTTERKDFYEKLERVCKLTSMHEEGFLEEKDFTVRDILNDLILNFPTSDVIKEEFAIINQKIKEANLLVKDLVAQLLSYD